MLTNGVHPRMAKYILLLDAKNKTEPVSYFYLQKWELNWSWISVKGQYCVVYLNIVGVLGEQDNLHGTPYHSHLHTTVVMSY